MTNFHSKFHDVFWTFGEFKVEGDGVAFDFDRYWTIKDDSTFKNGVYCSSASELIKFNEKGMVTSIEYIDMPSDQIFIGEFYPDSRSVLMSEAAKIVDDTNSLYPTADFEYLDAQEKIMDEFMASSIVLMDEDAVEKENLRRKNMDDTAV
eukprot:CAMPEP_0119052180 /NCGR_PEP_ID=MMETSP1177-20130426/73566_1 /TAXON_ID=2985 /ORGANISM="Ochromonas sp, Strain CCMP1899" /LENGTH=149 /DNA_ID=CAMNT_0007031669 /DNA_START=222 /DNA_END=671 /DNA_ORIENTATION=-